MTNISRVLLSTSAVALVAGGCWPVERTEVARLSGPGGDLDVVTVQTNAGATTGFGTRVFIVPRGENAPEDEDEAVFAGYRLDDVTVDWLRRDVIAISYADGVVYQYRNFWPLGSDGEQVRVAVFDTWALPVFLDARDTDEGSM